MVTLLKNKTFQLCLAIFLGLIVWFLPRPEGTRFRILGDADQQLLAQLGDQFILVPSSDAKPKGYVVEVTDPEAMVSPAKFLKLKAVELQLDQIRVEYVNGLSPKGLRFLAVLVVLVFLFIAESIPLEITAICIGVLLVMTGVSDLKDTWASYMHPVVVFIICCLVFAIALDKTGLTKRLGYFIVRRAGNSVTRFTFIIAIGLGIASSLLHDAAATAKGSNLIRKPRNS